MINNYIRRGPKGKWQVVKREKPKNARSKNTSAENRTRNLLCTLTMTVIWQCETDVLTIGPRQLSRTTPEVIIGRITGSPGAANALTKSCFKAYIKPITRLG